MREVTGSEVSPPSVPPHQGREEAKMFNLRSFGGLGWGEALSSFEGEVAGSEVSPPLPLCSSQGQALSIRGGRRQRCSN